MKMYLLSDNIDTHTGMRLAGVEGEVLHTREDLLVTVVGYSLKYVRIISRMKIILTKAKTRL